jgi:TP901 family phage tail tape measure protein
MADEIGEALQRVASAAENSNVSLEKSASWLATISSVTRESASTIGRSLNSIISRYESIKKNGFNEEDATKINEVTQALAKIGINPTVNGQLRDLTEVIDELGGKWDGLNKNEQAYIATTLAG